MVSYNFSDGHGKRLPYTGSDGRIHDMWKCSGCRQTIPYEQSTIHWRLCQEEKFRSSWLEMDPFASADWEDY